MGTLGTQELLIVLAILMIMTGGKRLPGMAASLGQALRELRTSLREPEPPGGTPVEREP